MLYLVLAGAASAQETFSVVRYSTAKAEECYDPTSANHDRVWSQVREFNVMREVHTNDDRSCTITGRWTDQAGGEDVHLSANSYICDRIYILRNPIFLETTTDHICEAHQQRPPTPSESSTRTPNARLYFDPVSVYPLFAPLNRSADCLGSVDSFEQWVYRTFRVVDRDPGACSGPREHCMILTHDRWTTQLDAARSPIYATAPSVCRVYEALNHADPGRRLVNLQVLARPSGDHACRVEQVVPARK